MSNTTGLSIRKMSTITPQQGIADIDWLVETIDQTPQLAAHKFGIDVRESLLSMRARLMDGCFFSANMEKALNNWGKAIAKWIHPPKGGLDS